MGIHVARLTEVTTVYLHLIKMFPLLLISLTISMVVGQTPPHPTEDGIACEECVREMHRFGQLIHDGREAMAGYLAENYCPTLGEHAQDCPENLAGHYPDMVNAVVDRFIAGEQGALHMCQSMGACRPVKIFTCEECIEGMEWIEAYMEDPIFQAEAALFLEQHWCSPERPQCIPAIQHHFIPMHVMVMERFMVPTDICNNQFAACNPDWTTHPHPTEGPHPTHPHPTHPRM